MTDDPTPPVRIIDGRISPRELARLMGCSVSVVDVERAQLRGEWCGCVFETGDDGLRRPEHHGKMWNPRKGEARRDPWPDGTYGHQPRNKVRRWRKAMMAPVSGEGTISTQCHPPVPGAGGRFTVTGVLRCEPGGPLRTVEWEDGRVGGDPVAAVEVAGKASIDLDGVRVGPVGGPYTYADHLAEPLAALSVMLDHVFATDPEPELAGDVPERPPIPPGAIG